MDEDIFYWEPEQEMILRNGQPSLHLCQFLRTIAQDIIDNYEPLHSGVITPAKLKEYYKKHAQAEEPYPWSPIFNRHSSSLSSLYCELSIEHYLVQTCLSKRPEIPGMTAAGFEVWSIQLIRAHPRNEYRRLEHIARTIKTLNLHHRSNVPPFLRCGQFPSEPDDETATRLRTSLIKHCHLISYPSRRMKCIESDPRRRSSGKGWCSDP